MSLRVLVTGGSRGIGRAVALNAASAGFEVVLTYQSRESSAQEVVKEIQANGGQAMCAALDVSDRGATRELSFIQRRLGEP